MSLGVGDLDADRVTRQDGVQEGLKALLDECHVELVLDIIQTFFFACCLSGKTDQTSDVGDDV